jgi:MFS family permease
MALGPMIGGVLIDKLGIEHGVRLSFVLAFVLGFISTIIQQYTLKNDKPRELKETGMAIVPFTAFPTGLRTLLLSDILVRFSEQMPYAYIAIWAVTTKGGAGVTASQFGIVTAIEMFVALLVYIPVAFFADKMNKKPFVVTTYIFFTLFPLLLWLSTSFGMLIFAFIIRGLKEFGEPTRKSMIMDLAPEDQKPVFFGSYYFYRDIVVTISAIIGAFLWNSISPAAMFICSTAFGMLGCLVFAFWGKEAS